MRKTRPRKLINSVCTHPIIHSWEEAFKQLAGASARTLWDLTHRLLLMKDLDCTHTLLSALFLKKLCCKPALCWLDLLPGSSWPFRFCRRDRHGKLGRPDFSTAFTHVTLLLWRWTSFLGTCPKMLLIIFVGFWPYVYFPHWTRGQLLLTQATLQIAVVRWPSSQKKVVFRVLTSDKY